MSIYAKYLSSSQSGGSGAALTLAAVGSSPNANAATLTGTVLNLEPASASFPGVVTTGAQALAGVKTFGSAPIFSSVTASQVLAVDGSKALISVAYASANTASALVQRDGSGNFAAGTITAALTGTASGNTTYTANNHGVVLSSATNAMVVVAPVASTTKVLVSGGLSADPTWQDLASGALALAAFGAVPNANGASLSGATLTLQPANATNPGGISTAAQSIPGAKTFLEAIQINSDVAYAHTTYQPAGALAPSNPAWETGFRQGQPYYSIVMNDGSSKTTFVDYALNGIVDYSAIVNAPNIRTDSIATQAGSTHIDLTVAGQGTQITSGSDLIQLAVKGNGTQTADVFEVLKSDNTVLMSVDNAGKVSGVSAVMSATAVIGAANLTPYTNSGTTIAAAVKSGGAGSLVMAAYGGTPAFRSYQASGTVGSPTASPLNTTLLELCAHGYGTTGFSANNRGQFDIVAAETWTDAAQGTYMKWNLTPVGSTTGAEYMRLTAAGALGIGTTAPDGTLEVVGTGTNIFATSYGANVGLLTGRSANGTAASPTATQSGDLIAAFFGRGYGASAFSSSGIGGLGVIAAENFTNSAQGTKVDLFTTATGSTSRSSRLSISSAGVVSIPNLTASQAIFTDGSKNLVSNAITGTGNVVMSTSATLVTPALGTPTALIGTNITGTAAGLTAGTVTTNANLTGVITSSGNATSIASQTGTGSKFVVDTSPTIITPIITNNAVVSGTGTVLTSLESSGNGSAKYYQIKNTNGAPTTVSWIVGADYNANNVLEITPSTANGGTTFNTAAIKFSSAGVVTIPNLAGAGSRAVNADASGVLSAASDARLKQEVPEAPIPGLAEVMQLQPRAYKWLDDIANRGDNAAVEIGFFANDVAPIIPSAAPMGNDGYYGFYDRAVTAALVKAIQELKAENDDLKARLDKAGL